MYQKMILATAAALALLIAPGAAVAGHHGGDYEDHAEKHLQKLTKKLELTDAQVPQVAAILEQARAERWAIGDRYTLNQKKEAHEEMQALRERTHEQIKALLTAEQAERFDAMHARHHERKKRHAMHREKHMHGDDNDDRS